MSANFSITPGNPNFGTVIYGQTSGTDAITFELTLKNTGTVPLYAILAYVNGAEDTWSLTFNSNYKVIAPGKTNTITGTMFSDYPGAPAPGFFTPVHVKQVFTVMVLLGPGSNPESPSISQNFFVTGTIVHAPLEIHFKPYVGPPLKF